MTATEQPEARRATQGIDDDAARLAELDMVFASGFIGRFSHTAHAAAGDPVAGEGGT